MLLSARRVGSTGKVYGLDMTDEMLDLARDNQRKAGVENVEFLKGDIQAIPLPSNSVDVVISNCVINLAPDKSKVLAEAFRVLKPGGRFAVSDVVVRGEVSPALRRDMELWVGCIAGALDETDYKAKLGCSGIPGCRRRNMAGVRRSWPPKARGNLPARSSGPENRRNRVDLGHWH